MATQDLHPVFAFVWRADEISGNIREIREMADRTSSTAIFDVGDIASEHFQGSLASAAGDLKISAEQFFDPVLDDHLGETDVKKLWIEYHPALSPHNPDSFIDRLHIFSNICDCIPVVSDPDLVARFAGMESGPKTIALKGLEASGFVSGETIGTLFSTASKNRKSGNGVPAFIIWGGISTPEAAAAFLCTGAAGIVFESLHWLTDMWNLPENLRERIGKIRPEHTSVMGLSTLQPVRVFDKGNSMAARDIKEKLESCFNRHHPCQDCSTFNRYIHDSAVHPLRSTFSSNELIFLGPEAAFAGAFVKRFGRSAERAMASFIKETLRLSRTTREKRAYYFNSPAAAALGTKFPIIQGAMSWISDVPEFALSVAESGGLPTLALGLRNREQIEKDLGRLKKIMKGLPYAVNVITLPENPHRDQQLAWIEENRPPFAVIAAGDPSHAAGLRSKGIEVIYVASDKGLFHMALKEAFRFIILEGIEAGGHVGEHSTVTLAQIALDLKRREPDLFKDKHIFFAGGIFDRETAFRAAMTGADGVQMGTAYLASEEIVSSGALDPLYQRMILEAPPGMTTISGESIGLRVRSLLTPKTSAIHSLEQEFKIGKIEERALRRRLEEISAGSLLIAARGKENHEGAVLEEENRLKEGQFMSGAAAGNITHPISLADLHREVSEGYFEPLASLKDDPVKGPPCRAPSPSAKEKIAVTGMALVNALGNSPEEIWKNVIALKCGITETIESGLDLSNFYDPDPRKQEKTYCKIGAFQNIRISRKEIQVAPQDFRTMAESTKLTLWLADRAVHDSRILDSGIPPERISVLVSQNSGEAASTVEDLSIRESKYEILHAVQHATGFNAEKMAEIEKALLSGRINIDDTTLLGRLNCAAGGFICNRFGFMGPTHSVSAACATSLVALFNAVQMIDNGIIDAAVIGGAEELLRPAHYLEFSALGALAGISGTGRPPYQCSRPFDAARDGMVLGEGGGIIVIEKESIARKRGATIHALITGVGASNNDKGMVEPLAKSQKIAMLSSLRDASYGPETIDLVECHATSTLRGDIEEAKALKAVFPRNGHTLLASFKSQIGHTLGASGINSIIRGITAMNEGTYPPTLNYENMDPEIALEDWGFRVPVQPESWPQSSGRPRRFQTNAFGFGGANYVVQLEQSLNGGTTAMVSGLSKNNESDGRKNGNPSSVEGVFFFNTSIHDEKYRLGVLAENENAAKSKIDSLRPIPASDRVSSKTLRYLAGQGIFAAPEDGEIESPAFVFAGQGTHYTGMGKELYDTFPVIRKWMDRAADVADFDILHLLFNSKEENLQKTRWQQPAMFTMEYAMVQYLISLGIQPVAMAGHSLGELVALCVAGVFSFEDGFRIVNKRALCMDKAAGLSMDPGIMFAVDAPLDDLKEKTAENDKVFFTNFNSPNQIVLGGGTQEASSLMEELGNEGYRTTKLKVSMAFHSPIMKVIHDELDEYIAGIPFHSPRIPVISNTTMEPFPDNPDQIKEIVMAHLESPVHWMQNVETLWRDYGVGLFIEIGPKDTLCGLISDTLPEAHCIETCRPEEEAKTYRTAVGRLFALGQMKPPSQAPYINLPGLAPHKTGSGTSPVPSGNPVTAIVQREISAFILESFGKFLKPHIIEVVRKEADPYFNEEKLNTIIGSGFAFADTAPPQPKAGMAHPSVHRARQNQGPAEADIHPALESQQPHPADADYLEKIIGIIIDATGYDRDEIEPDMDIRQDLAIRSSRLPVIMDSAEQQFDIEINIEDFIGVRTVRELSNRIESLAKGKTSSVTAPRTKKENTLEPLPELTSALDSGISGQARRTPLERFIFNETPITIPLANRLKLEPNQDVIVVTASHESSMASEMEAFLEKEFKSKVNHLDIKRLTGGEDNLEMSSLKPAITKSPAGLVLLLDSELGIPAGDMEGVSKFLTGLFRLLQIFLRSDKKRFCCAIRREGCSEDSIKVASEGVLGMFLAAAQEYDSVLFRSITIDQSGLLKDAFDRSFDTESGVVQRIFRGRKSHTLKAEKSPVVISHVGSGLKLDPDQVIIISGGGKGVTNHLARALAPFGGHLMLLGRTELDDSLDYEALLNTEDAVEENVRYLVLQKYPGLREEELSAEITRVKSCVEIAGNIRDISALGPDASYLSCDVSDPGNVKEIIEDIMNRYGRIDGIIHGAGVIRDSFIDLMPAVDFEEVVKIKLVGAWNLYQETRDKGLQFMTVLSSVTAVQGNVGQINYCGGNRALSALVNSIAQDRSRILCKALMLPPIEGTGMADNPEIKELLKLRGMESSYVHINELGEFFMRELLLANPDECWVMPARNLPETSKAIINTGEPGYETENLAVSGTVFDKRDLPMITFINHLDHIKGELSATRYFSNKWDLWIEDHKPIQSLKYPLVSGIMAIEAFFEAAHVMCPWLKPSCIREVEYKDIIECRPDVDREARINCVKHKDAGKASEYQISLSSRDISPTGRPLDSWSENYTGRVILGPHRDTWDEMPDFIPTSGISDGAPLARETIEKWYEKGTGLKGRYRVLESMSSRDHGMAKGTTIYAETEDFADKGKFVYHYSPYLLEAIMHMVTLYIATQENREKRASIPAAIGEISFARRCRPGEKISLEARIISEDQMGHRWDARGLDDKGLTIMIVKGLEMRWFSE